MRVTLLVLLSLLWVSASQAAPPPNGDGTIYPSDAVLQRIKVSEDITPETTELLGERIDLASGSLSFNQTDVAIPGPAGLDIVISRSWRGGKNRLFENNMGDWQFEIPRIETKIIKWSLYSSGAWGQGELCSGSIEPLPFYAGIVGYLYPEEYYSGVSINVPGKIQEKLREFHTNPVWRHTTNSDWRLRCIVRNDGEEGFIAQSPDGIEYTFDIPKTRVGDVVNPAKLVQVFDAYLYVSKIKDRFGNEINYQYNSSNIVISSSDGRSVTINFNGDGVVSSIATDFGQWNYSYVYDNYGHSRLATVTLPDGKSWQYDLSNLFVWGKDIHHGVDGNGVMLSCTPRGTNFVGSVTHPYGVKGTFTLKPAYHGRTDVPDQLIRPKSFSHCYTVASLKTKVLEVPGSSTYTWNYYYSENDGAHLTLLTPQPPSGALIRSGIPAEDIKTTKVSTPNGSTTVHQFLRTWDYREGKEIRTEYYSYGTLTKLVDNYISQGDCEGFTGLLLDNMSPDLCKVRTDKVVVTEFGSDGASSTFTTENSAFNQYDTPTIIHEYNSVNSAWQKYTRLGYSHYDGEQAPYLLINVPTTVELSSNGSSWTEVSENTYHASTGNKPYLPYESKIFNTWISKNIDYFSNGDLKKTEFNESLSTSGNRWVEYSNYFRGQPQTFKVPHPLGGANPLIASQVINNDGTVSSTTDFNSTTLQYQYDAMRRLTLINNPSGWNDTTFVFSPITSSEASAFGLDTRQFKRVINKGNLQRNIFFDGLLRPVLESKKDTNSGITYYQNRAFDAYSNVTFESYWSTSPNETSGTQKYYDGLNRPTSIVRTSDLATNTTEYLSGNRIRVTNPRGYQTTTTNLSYGDPSEASPVTIQAPEGITTSLTYNLFGKVESITQGGVTQYNYYDSQQRLCRTERPEFGDNVFSYSTGGQLQWEARGQNLSGSGCLQGSVSGSQKINYSYTDLGKLKTVNFPDATPDLTYTYDNNGNILSLNSSNGINWLYNYNNLGLLEDETLQIDGHNFLLNYGYNGNGDLSSIIYPSGTNISTNPDAFGRVRQAGTYATNVNYHPNDTISSFAYGNGIVHTTQLNSENLPDLRRDLNGSTPIFSQTSYYDAASNITAINDGVDSYYNVSMTYDGLDRLDTANGSWGAGSVAYDVLGNITQLTLGDFSIGYQYDGQNRLDYISGSESYIFNYDGYGNVTDNGHREFSFNMANQMVASEGNNYLYDGNDKRVKVVAGGSTTYSMYSLGGQLMYKWKTDGTASDYIYLGSRMVAKNATGPTSQPPTGSPNLTVPSSSNGSFAASWNSVSGAKFYLLQWESSTGHWQSLYNSTDLTTNVYFPESGTYKLKVAACSAAGCGPFSAIKNTSVVTVPAKPSSINVPSGSNGSGSYSVSWASVSNAASYTLQEQKNSGSWTTVASPSSTSYSISGRSNGSYRYRVRACNAAGCSSYRTSGTFSVLLPPGTPGSISTPSGTDIDGSYSISWASVSTATSYTLQEQKNSGSWTTVNSPSATSQSISGRTNGSYRYRVRACNASGCSTYRNSGTFSVLLPPPAPSSVTAPSSDTNGSYTVNWSSASTATSYTVQEQVNGGGWNTINTTASTSHGISGKPNGTYRYRVQSCNSSGCSGWQYSGNVTVLFPPGTPSSISSPTGTDTDGTYSISWPSVSTATSYTLQEQFNSGSWSTSQTSSATSKSYSGRGNGSYRYRVRACNSSGCGGYRYSATFSVLLPPGAPSLYAPSSDGDGSYSVTWGTVSTATSYTLQQKIGSGAWSAAYSGSGTSKSYTSQGENTYYYRARACNASGCGSYSSTRTVVVDYPQVTSLSANPSVRTSPGNSTITWQSANASSCVVKVNGAQIGGSRPTNGSTSVYVGSTSTVQVTCSNGSQSHSSSVTVVVKYGGGGPGL